jgi:hypothetical protein
MCQLKIQICSIFILFLFLQKLKAMQLYMQLNKHEKNDL